ncbi:MAG: hypothetical protein ACYC35_22995 [Pirellulales bacterium]
MSTAHPPISVNVDLSNPGQFFACCGLLELADRLWTESSVLGAFSSSQFHVWADLPDVSLRRIIDSFVNTVVQQLDCQDAAASPLLLGEPFCLRLDWWRKVEAPDKRRVDMGGGDQLKPWAGKQFGPLIFDAMKSACVGLDLVAPFDDSRAVYGLKDGKVKKKTISPFYFDSRREETSLDIGFSPDEQDMSVNAYPAVESLALVGLQRFRPAVDDGGSVRSFLYTAWSDPLPPAVAMATVSGRIPAGSCGTFRFTKPSRGGEYLTMFSRATRERSKHVSN